MTNNNDTLVCCPHCVGGGYSEFLCALCNRDRQVPTWAAVAYRLACTTASSRYDRTCTASDIRLKYTGRASWPK